MWLNVTIILYCELYIYKLKISLAVLKNPLKNSWIQTAMHLDHPQNLISSSLYYFQYFLKISSKSVYNFLSYVANKQTHKQTNKQTPAKTLAPWRRKKWINFIVITVIVLHFKTISEYAIKYTELKRANEGISIIVDDSNTEPIKWFDNIFLFLNLWMMKVGKNCYICWVAPHMIKKKHI